MKLWRVDDVMTKDVVAVRESLPYHSVVDLLIGHRVSALPVIDSTRQVVGVVSEADLLLKISRFARPRLLSPGRYGRDRRKGRGRTAGDVMSTPAVTALASLSLVAAARRMQGANVKRLPVTDDLGRLVGIVTRSDLLRVHQRLDADLRRDLREVVPPAGPTGADDVEVVVADSVVTLSGRVHLHSSAERMTLVAAQVPGVSDVVDQLVFDIEDLLAVGSGVGAPFGVA